MEFRDLKTQYMSLKRQIDAAIDKVVINGTFIMGKEVAQLEEALANYVGVHHCVTCASGTDALQMVLAAWGIGPGDAVFVPAFTFVAPAEAAVSRGAEPVFVDVEEDTYTISPDSLEQAVEAVRQEGRLNAKAVIPVDLFGLPADYRRILPLAQKYGLKVLEDGAQGFGGSLDGQRACSFGDAAATSFFPAKPLGCYGDGGAVFTQDQGLADLIRSLRAHGRGDSRYEHIRPGFNSRLDTLQASVLLVKLEAFSHYELEASRQAAKLYDTWLNGMVRTPVIPKGFQSGFAQYTIQMKDGGQRDFLQERLRKWDIPTTVYYPAPLHTQPVFSGMGGGEGEFPVAEALCKRVLSLPMHPYLQPGDIRRVTAAIGAEYPFLAPSL